MTTQKSRRAFARPQESVSTTEDVVSDGASDGTVAEITRAWRQYALRFLRSSWNSPPVVIGVTSATRREGRTTGSLCLAMSLTEETSTSVALLGLDYQGYGLAEAFGIKDGPDLEGVLRGTWKVQAALCEVELPGLAVLPARAGNSRQRLVPKSFWSALRRRLPDLLAGMRRDFPYVVCDLPPLLDNAEAGDLAREMDAVVMLTRAGVTPIRKLEEALTLVDRDRLAGAVHIGGSSALPKWLTAFLLE